MTASTPLPRPFGIPLDRLRTICPNVGFLRLKHDEVIYGQGEACSDLFLVQTGTACLSRVSSDGKIFTSAWHSAGDLFGPGLAFMDAVLAEETATARGSVDLVRFTHQELRALAVAHAEIGAGLLTLLARRQNQMSRRLACFAFQPAEARLAETLRELSGGFEDRCTHGFGKHLRITQQELADLVSASRPVVSTILNRLRAKGVLGYSREYLCVRDIAEIEVLVGL